MMAGVDDAMVLPDQLAARVLRDLAKLVVGVGDDAAVIGAGDDRRLVERVAHLLQLGDLTRSFVLARRRRVLLASLEGPRFGVAAIHACSACQCVNLNFSIR